MHRAAMATALRANAARPAARVQREQKEERAGERTIAKILGMYTTD